MLTGWKVSAGLALVALLFAFTAWAAWERGNRLALAAAQAEERVAFLEAAADAAERVSDRIAREAAVEAARAEAAENATRQIVERFRNAPRPDCRLGDDDRRMLIEQIPIRPTADPAARLPR